MAIGFLGAGIFVTDPMNGYPPGTPGLPLEYSVSGRLHRLFSALVFLGLPLACAVFARLFARWGDRGWTVFSVVTSIGFVVMFVVTSAGFAQVEGLVNDAGLFQRITLTIGWTWLTLLAVYMLRAPSPPRA
jgi:hypothetical protein